MVSFLCLTCPFDKLETIMLIHITFPVGFFFFLNMKLVYGKVLEKVNNKTYCLAGCLKIFLYKEIKRLGA